MSKNVYIEDQTSLFDKNTGAEIGATTKIRRTAMGKSDEPPYAKLYFDHLIEFSGGIKSASTLLLKFCEMMTYGSDPDGTDANIVYVNSTFIRNYMKQNHCTRDTYYKQLKSLIDTNIVHRIDRGTFQVNPNLVGKGDWVKNGIKKLRATFDYVTGEVTTDIEANDSNNYRQMDIFGNDHKIITDKHGHRDYAD